VRAFRRFLESDMLAIVFWRSHGTIEAANDAFLKIVGYTRADLQAGLLNKSVITPKEYAHLDSLKWAEIVERGTIVPYEKEYLRKDGRRVSGLIGASMIDVARDTRVSFVPA